MKWLIVAALLLAAWLTPSQVDADPGQAPPPQPPLANQPNPDIYTCCGIGTIDHLNTAQDIMLRTGEVRWHYEVTPGCEGLGSIKALVQEGQQVWADEIGIRWVEDVTGPYPPTSWAFVFNCGVSWKALCPGAVGCLAHSWPRNGRIDFDGPTLLSYAFRISQVSVVVHEICHQILTCNEQYDIQRFACIPGWGPDFMNCGPDSRYGFTEITKERVKRIAYPAPLTVTGYGFNGSWYVYACGFDTVRAKRLSVLVDRHDGRGIVWAGVYPEIKRDANGCMGIGLAEGLRIEIGADYFLKQESAVSAFKWWNETCVKASVRCP